MQGGCSSPNAYTNMSKLIGICKNEKCEYCEHEVLQEVDQEKPVCQGCSEILELSKNGEIKPPKNWNRILLILAAILILGGMAFGIMTLFKNCVGHEPEIIDYPITPDSITLNKNSLEFVNVGERDTLVATIYPDSLLDKYKMVIWRSSDETVAEVDENGVVTAIAKGKTEIITFTGNGFSDTCEVIVGKVIPVTYITLNDTAFFLKTGESKQLKQTVYPEDATNKEITWTSYNPIVAKVDSTGVITAIAEGTANITVTTVDGGKTATCIVTVKNIPPPPIEIKVSGGVYTGQTKNGKPHGMGTIRYNSRTLIDSRDMKKRYAEAGQSITGQFENGRLLQGKLFDSNGNQIEVIIIGGGAY